MTAMLLAQRRVHLPKAHVGQRLHFADGTSARVYRDSVVDRPNAVDPCVLVVRFRLKLIRNESGHAAFRYESILNTPMFIGFPGYVSKLWVAHDENGYYRGVYEWDGAARAVHYARSLWRVLAVVSEPESIRYKVIPSLRRDEAVRSPALMGDAFPEDAKAWWRLVAVT
jgi:hypothetical protein